MGADGILNRLSLSGWWGLSNADIEGGVCVQVGAGMSTKCRPVAVGRFLATKGNDLSSLPQTCAHRYESRQRVDQILETRDVIGRCFVLSQDLAIRDQLDGGEWKFCEGRPQSHEQFGFCQQGTAAAFTPDSHYLLFGAPGTYNWKGESLLRGEGNQNLLLQEKWCWKHFGQT